MTDVEQASSRDAGMTLIEVIVALGLFAVMSTAVLSVLTSAIHATTDDKSRIEAVNLASRELEIVRDTFSSVTRGPDKVVQNVVVNANPLPGGTAGQPIVVDGVPYTVTRTARWEQIGAADAQLSPCDQGSSSELVVLHVSVDVTWPALGSRPPVTMDTIMTPPKGTYSTLDGHLGLRVLDSEGHPRPNVTVTAVNGGLSAMGVTAADGCVLLAHLPAGDWTLTASNPNFVNRAGDPTASIVAHLQAGQLWRGSIEYDAAAAITATIGAPSGFDVPADVTALPMTLGNSALQPIGVKTVPGTGSTRLIEHLWPYPDGYGVWLGGCEDGNPSVTGDGLPVAVTRGTTTVASVQLGGVEIHTAPGTQLTAVHAADRSCTAPLTIQLGTAQAAAPDPSPSATAETTTGATDGPVPGPSAAATDTASPTASPTDSPTASPTEVASGPADPGGVLRVALPYGTWTIGDATVRIGPGNPMVLLL
ncbi:prepilin-type N-terminal cleavage/methylation domain-containing protein [Nocardioides aquiterrae]|uniref:Prepilin-type N-terminal cleavage/methylation domain-containing protein n=1 Tax=Nocardioides aquiterrae TaxID=203799 RepID=A0ABP4F7R0_9ACTN